MRSTNDYIVTIAPPGLWWVRWIDQVAPPYRKGSTPQVRVILEEIDESRQEPLTSNHIFPTPGRKKPILVDAGMIPLIPIGTVIQDRKICGFIPSPIKSFNIDTDNCISQSVTKELPDKPQWWRPELPYRPISRKLFPLDGYLNGNCTIFTSANSTIATPDCEIFRCFYAPISYLANIFLSTSIVDEYIEQLIQSSESYYCEKNNTIEIVIRKGFPSDHKLFLANLLIHPYGRRCLNYLSGSLLSDEGNLKALIPFRTSSLKVSGRCYKLCEHTNRYLLYNITHVDWPDDYPDINYRYDKSNEKGKSSSDSDKPNPYSQYSPTYYNLDDSAEDPPTILNEEEPSAPNPTPIKGLNATWSNQPKEFKKPKEISESYSDEEKSDPKYRTTSEISTGNPFGTKAGIANGEAVPEPADYPITERFGLILKIMSMLVQHPQIKSVKSVNPKIVTITRSGRAAHEFPKEYQMNPMSKVKTRLSWSTLKIGKADKIPRAAFIFEIKDMYNRTTYWIEIESTQTVSYHSVKYKYIDNEKSTNHEDIKLMLTLIALGKGKKKEIMMLSQKYFPEVNIDFWKHKFSSKNELDLKDVLNEILSIGLFDYLKWCSNSSPTQST